MKVRKSVKSKEVVRLAICGGANRDGSAKTSDRLASAGHTLFFAVYPTHS